MWSPIPWYYEYFQAADRANCSPWELIDDYTPREFWFEAAKIVGHAEAEHATNERNAAERKNAQQQANTVRQLGKSGRR